MVWPFKKAKAALSFSEIAPDGLIDLHSHVLPRVDDGAADWDESIAMLDGYDELGYVRVVATPHFNSRQLMPDVATQQDLIKELFNRRAGRGPEVLPGGEIIFDEVFVAEEMRGAFPQIGKGRTYLVEFGFRPGSVPCNFEDIAFNFQVKGGTLILAHPERIPDFQRDAGLMKSLSRAGTLVQVDLMSLAGKYGKLSRKTAEQLLDEDIVDLVSSDLHHARELPDLRRALEELAQEGTEELVRLASLNPRLVLEGRSDEVTGNA